MDFDIEWSRDLFKLLWNGLWNVSNWHRMDFNIYNIHSHLTWMTQIFILNTW
jgi:hypothetical protein